MENHPCWRCIFNTSTGGRFDQNPDDLERHFGGEIRLSHRSNGDDVFSIDLWNSTRNN